MAIESNIPYVSVCDGKGKRLGAIEGEEKEGKDPFFTVKNFELTKGEIHVVVRRYGDDYILPNKFHSQFGIDLKGAYAMTFLQVTHPKKAIQIDEETTRYVFNSDSKLVFRGPDSYKLGLVVTIPNAFDPARINFFQMEIKRAGYKYGMDQVLWNMADQEHPVLAEEQAAIKKKEDEKKKEKKNFDTIFGNWSDSGDDR